jgi:heme/copper-type cytochrome/quinol oxidase subunit 2
MTGLEKLIDQFTNWVLLIVPLVITLSIVFFFWGLVKFIYHAEDERTHEEGRRLMIWGMIALFVMVAFWGIIGWVQQSLDVPASGFTETPIVSPDIP